MKKLFSVVKLLAVASIAMLVGVVGGVSLRHVPVEIPDSPISIEDVFQPLEIANRNVPNSVLSHTVSIHIVQGDHSSPPIGTGVVLRHGSMGYTVLTAEHVLMAAWPSSLEACSIINELDCILLGSAALVQTSVDSSSDWAVFDIDTPPLSTRPAKLANQPADIGDNVLLAGMPWGRSPWLSQGSIAWKVGQEGNEMYFLNGFAAPGFSGGGVFDERGRLIGITVALAVSEWGPQENMILMVPIQNISLYR